MRFEVEVGERDGEDTEEEGKGRVPLSHCFPLMYCSYILSIPIDKVYMDDGEYDDTNRTHLIIVTSFIDFRIVVMSRMARICTSELPSQQHTTNNEKH